ncbi:hypothetical protein QAD02_019781 [Eretmocerus hayati]|uniref:Uncharacterized protein n=1 Tax=Eretmocerus hayati TaxID=131215 RepID=A0ACC2PN34_9HYME|nr:hypothetical protein QAD02_019781 [Eretmocerus hayati]
MSDRIRRKEREIRRLEKETNQAWAELEQLEQELEQELTYEDVRRAEQRKPGPRGIVQGRRSKIDSDSDENRGSGVHEPEPRGPPMRSHRSRIDSDYDNNEPHAHAEKSSSRMEHVRHQVDSQPRALLPEAVQHNLNTGRGGRGRSRVCSRSPNRVSRDRNRQDDSPRGSHSDSASIRSGRSSVPISDGAEETYTLRRQRQTHDAEIHEDNENQDPQKEDEDEIEKDLDMFLIDLKDRQTTELELKPSVVKRVQTILSEKVMDKDERT